MHVMAGRVDHDGGRAKEGVRGANCQQDALTVQKVHCGTGC